MVDSFVLANGSVVVATMHGKERVIGPVLADLGMRVLAIPQIDTDRFGTFTRDVARSGSQVEALLAKAQAGLGLAPDADFVVASEGAFGPHPQIPFLPSGLEMVALLQRQTGKAIIGRELTAKTNFAQVEARSWQEIKAFADRIGFPDHAMIVMNSQEGPIIAKGIEDARTLSDLALPVIRRRGAVWLESDMRAHFNPTRMESIALATADLARRLGARCPQCGFPGWIPRLRGGRPCSWCEGPTHESWIEVLYCQLCDRSQEQTIEPVRKADPGHCPSCNP